MNRRIKIVIADDHPVIRRGLVGVIGMAADLDVVGEADDGRIALKIIRTQAPDVVVLDIDMPVLDGIETAKLIHSSFPNIKIIFLTMRKDEEVLDKINKNNVKGYIMKECAVLEIVDCIRQVAAGNLFISPELPELFTKSEVEVRTTETGIKSPIADLSGTEIRILQQISRSKTSREIAEELFVSVRTIENHRFNICTKLKIRGKHSLLMFTLKNKEIIFASNKDKKLNR